MAEIAIAFAVYVALARLSRADLLGLLRAPTLNFLVIGAVNDENEVVMSRLEGMKGFIVLRTWKCQAKKQDVVEFRFAICNMLGFILRAGMGDDPRSDHSNHLDTGEDRLLGFHGTGIAAAEGFLGAFGCFYIPQWLRELLRLLFIGNPRVMRISDVEQRVRWQRPR